MDNEELEAMKHIMRREKYYLAADDSVAYYDAQTHRLTYIEWLATNNGWRVKAMLDDPIGFAYAYMATCNGDEKQPEAEADNSIKIAAAKLDRLAKQEEKKRREAEERAARQQARAAALQEAFDRYEEAGDNIVHYNLRTCPMTEKECAYIKYLTLLYDEA